MHKPFTQLGKFKEAQEVKKESYSDDDYIKAIDRLIDILEDNNDHSGAAVIFSMMHDRNPDKTKALFDTWYRRETQGGL